MNGEITPSSRLVSDDPDRSSRPAHLGMRACRAALLLLALTTIAAPALAAPPATRPSIKLPERMPSSPGFHIIKTTVTLDGKTITFASGVFLPPAYFASKEPFPIVMMLHNRGAEGDGQKDKIAGEGLALMLAQDNFDDRSSTKPAKNAINLRTEGRFIGLAPQCPPNWGWESPAMAPILDELIAQIAHAYRGDENRVYLTGFSYGGTNTWTLAMRLPARFAGIIPLSGRAPAEPAKAAASLSQIAVWFAAGESDWARGETERMMEAMKAARHPNYKAMIIPGGNHWSYSSIYNDPAFWTWLFAQSRQAPTTRP